VPEPVRIGLAGYGLGGRYFHAPLIASAENCDFLGVVTTSPERRRQVAEDINRPTFAGLEELARAGAEAVAISTPVATHVTLTHQALRLGLAVVCDKPFAPDANQARATVELAEQRKIPLTVYQNRRWDSDFLTLRELLDKGERGGKKEPVPSKRGAWNLFYPAFAEAVRGTRPVPVDPWDAVATAAVLDAARTSARTAQVVTPAKKE
jgi:predicted dehydrogenase